MSNLNVLSAATWQRDFLRNPKVVSEVHEEQIQSLLNRLPEAADRARAALHPNQRLEIGDDRKTVTIYDTSGAKLVSCHINTSEPGKLTCQFIGSKGERQSARIRLTLSCYAHDSFLWQDLSANAILPPTLPGYILGATIAVATQIVQDETPGHHLPRSVDF